MGKISISLPDDLEKRLQLYISKNKKKYNGLSDFYQSLTKDFLNPKNFSIVKDVLLLLIYPFVLLFILTRAWLQIGDIFYVFFSAGVMGMVLAGLYLYAVGRKGR